MERIRIDESQWPLVYIRYPKRIHHDDFMDHLARVAGYVQRRVPWGMLNDSRGSGHPDAKQRQAIVSLYDEHAEDVRRYWRGTAVVHDSAVIVGVLTALTWLRPALHPFKAFTDYGEGLAWVLERLPAGAVPARRSVASL